MSVRSIHRQKQTIIARSSGMGNNNNSNLITTASKAVCRSAECAGIIRVKWWCSVLRRPSTIQHIRRRIVFRVTERASKAGVALVVLYIFIRRSFKLDFSRTEMEGRVRSSSVLAVTGRILGGGRECAFIRVDEQDFGAEGW